MILNICAYDLIVPETSYESDAPWVASGYLGMALGPPEPLPPESGEGVRVRIVHISPIPGVLYSCMVLTPVEATSDVWPLHFHLDRRMTTRLCAGDVVHIRTTHCGGLGISIVRHGELLAAAGAVCSVPLGRHVIARHPAGLFDEALAVIRRRYSDFEWHETPVEVTAGDASRLLLRARTTVGDYEVYVVHGHLNGIPGTDASLAISRVGSGLEVAANTTALLLNSPMRAGGLAGLLGHEDSVRMTTTLESERWWSDHLSTVRTDISTQQD